MLLRSTRNNANKMILTATKISWKKLCPLVYQKTRASNLREESVTSEYGAWKIVRLCYITFYHCPLIVSKIESISVPMKIPLRETIFVDSTRRES